MAKGKKEKQNVFCPNELSRNKQINFHEIAKTTSNWVAYPQMRKIKRYRRVFCESEHNWSNEEIMQKQNIKEITTYERSSRVRKGKNNSQRILKNS